MRANQIQPIMPTQLHSDKELCQEFEWISQHQHIPYWRSKCFLVRLILGGGFRVGEALRIHTDDVTDEGLIQVWRSKTGRRRVVKASPELQPYLRQFVHEHRGKRLFEGITHVVSLQRWWDECFAAAGVPKIHKRCIHSGRHDYASYELSSRRLTLTEVQTQLGHVSPAMTQDMYLHAITSLMYEENKEPQWWAVARMPDGLSLVKSA